MHDNRFSCDHGLASAMLKSELGKTTIYYYTRLKMKSTPMAHVH